MKEHEKDIPGETGARMAHNFYDVLESLTKDAQISAVKDCVIDAVKKQEAWAIGISKHENRLKALYKAAMISRDL